MQRQGWTEARSPRLPLVYVFVYDAEEAKQHFIPEIRAVLPKLKTQGFALANSYGGSYRFLVIKSEGV